ncbi:TPA: endonuclease III domain-containing protein, partial [Campylobacter coli]|nr:endonuclease III domain-containing protein [Campylobacter coli]
MNGADIFKKLLACNLDFKEFDWLENQGLSDFELLISVILTQNTKWDNVLKALNNLKNARISSLEQLSNLSNLELATLIKPSGFYNTKAKRLKELA